MVVGMVIFAYPFELPGLFLYLTGSRVNVFDVYQMKSHSENFTVLGC